MTLNYLDVASLDLLGDYIEDRLVFMSPALLRPTNVRTEAMGFHTTHWTVVMSARSGDGPYAQDALAALCSTYWCPLYAFIRRKGADPHEAEDLTQEFFYRFLERRAVERVQPAAGKFRSFLLTCLKNFLANERDASCAQRRGGGQSAVRLGSGEAETHYLLEPADSRTPEAVFERRWAFAVLDQAMSLLRREYSAAEKGDQFEELQGFLPNGRGNLSRADLAAKRGVTVGAVDVAIHRLRQRFGVLLREQVARTVSSEAEVEDELRYLISAVGA